MRPGSLSLAPSNHRPAQEVSHVEIRIGIANTGRELNFETNEPAADVKKSIAAALDAGATHVTFAGAKGTVPVFVAQGNLQNGN